MKTAGGELNLVRQKARAKVRAAAKKHRALGWLRAAPAKVSAVTFCASAPTSFFGKLLPQTACANCKDET
jgi:hypothetical protein